MSAFISFCLFCLFCYFLYVKGWLIYFLILVGCFLLLGVVGNFLDRKKIYKYTIEFFENNKIATIDDIAEYISEHSSINLHSRDAMEYKDLEDVVETLKKEKKITETNSNYLIREDFYSELLSKVQDTLKKEFSKANILDARKLSNILKLDLELCRDLVDDCISKPVDDILGALQRSDYGFIYNVVDMTMFVEKNTIITETEVQTFFPKSKNGDLSERVILMLDAANLIEEIDDGLWRSVTATGDDLVRETIVLD